MAQTYQMKHNPQGTIYSLLTVESDGQMTMTFHGTDREICHEVKENADGWLCYPGGMFPGLESGKWQAVADVQGTVPAVGSEVQGTVPAVGSEAESERTTEGLSPMCADGLSPMCAESAVPVASEPTLRGQVPCNPPSATHTGDSPRHTGDSPREPRPSRQRKPRKPRVERQPSAISHQPSAISHQTSDIDRHQSSATLKAIGMVAAATVALFVIYETGLLIPLGLIGLATGGILK